MPPKDSDLYAFENIIQRGQSTHCCFIFHFTGKSNLLLATVCLVFLWHQTPYDKETGDVLTGQAQPVPAGNSQSFVELSNPACCPRERMSHRKGDAERKFWRTPELVERLIPHLDARSIARLAQLHHFTVEVLQAASFWKDLVRRTCLYDEVMPQSVFARTSKDWVEEKFDDHQRAIHPLTRLLKRMEDPRACLLQLLHVICERYPSVGLRDIDDKLLVFQVSCPCKTLTQSHAWASCSSRM